MPTLDPSACAASLRAKRALPRIAWALSTMLGAVGGFGVWSHDQCEPPASNANATPSVLRGDGQLWAGSARAEIIVDLPASLAGYGPAREDATSQATPIEAKTLALRAAGVSVCFVAVDAVYVTAELQRMAGSGAGCRVVLIATHTHSSISGFDERLAARVATAGGYEPAQVGRLASAIHASIAGALLAMTPARSEVLEGDLSDMVRSRSGGSVDSRATIFRVTGRIDSSAIGELIVLAAHPTTIPKSARVIDGDYPSRLAALREARNGGVTLVVQGASGDASVAPTFAGNWIQEVSSRIDRATLRQQTTGEVHMAMQTVQLQLPLPEFHGGAFALNWLVSGALCVGNARVTTIGALDVDALRLLLLPFEATGAEGLRLSVAAGASRVVSLAEGYQGYLDTEEAVAARRGESRLQYYPSSLAKTVEAAAATFSPVKGEALSRRTSR